MILRPIPINTHDRGVLTLSAQAMLQDPESGLPFHLIYKKIHITDRVYPGSEVRTRYNNLPPDLKTVKRFMSMKQYVQICADTAEEVKDQLVALNLSLVPLTQQEQLDVLKMDFLKLKDRFVDFVKKDTKIKTVEKFSSNQKFKEFRKDFESFIQDRNIYTHGRLTIRFPEQDFVIYHIGKNQAFPLYSIVTIEILSSYCQFYFRIIELFNAFQETRNNVH
jgi:hypothetical protein